MKKWTVVVLLVVLAAIATGRILAQTAAKAPAPQASTGHGRYQIVMRDGVRADTFLLDTETGKVWTRVSFTNVKGTPDVWVYEERLDNGSQRDSWEAHQEAAPK